MVRCGRGARMGRAVGFLLGLLLLPLCAYGARQDYHFRVIDSRTGLAQNSVNALHQDSRGFVWIATEGGLHRYDGYHLRLFLHDPDDPGSLPETFITALAEDDRGRLWIGTNTRFLASIDLASGQVERHLLARSEGGKSHRDRVTGLLHQPGVGLWVSTGQGVELFDDDTGLRERRLSFEGEIEGSLRLAGFALLADGSVLAATHEGLFAFASGSPLPRRLGPRRRLHAIHSDGADGVWIGAEDGLYRWRRGDAEPQRIWPAQGSGPAVRAIAIDAQQRLWLALHNSGLLRFDPISSEALPLRHEAELDGSLHEDRLSRLMIDRSGLLWIGGEARGVATTRPEGAQFSRVSETRNALDPVLINNVRTLFEDVEGALWIGTEGRGLVRLVGPQMEFESHYAPLRAAQPGNDGGAASGDAGLIRVFGIADAGEGRLWVSSDVGLFEYRPRERRARWVPLPPVPGKEGRVSDLRHLVRARDGRLWITTFSDGLLEWDPRSGQHRWFRHDPDDLATLSHPLVTYAFEDRDGQIWAGSLEGLNRINPVTGRVERLLHDPDDHNTLSGNLVRHIVQDREGALWVSTHSGLNRVDLLPEGGVRVERFGTARGLATPTVYAALVGSDGNLWLSGNSGLARLAPAAGEVLRYDLQDGLQDLEFNGAAALALRDGRLAFGGVRGLNLLDPLRFSPSPFEAPLRLTAIGVGRRLQAVQSLDMPTALTFKQSEQVLRVEFAALDFTFPERNRFRYRLEGFEDEWNDSGTRNQAAYTNLGPGQYRLRVQGSNRDGRVSSEEAQLAIEVLPPAWASLPALVGYAVLALLLLMLWLKRARSERARQQRLLSELSAREERLKLSLWGSGDEFWDWDIRSNRLYRVGAEQLLGPGADSELDTEDFRSRAVHPEDIRRLQQIMQAHIAGRTEFFESEHRVRRGDGDWVWVRSRGKVVDRDAAGTPIRMAGTARDITESRAAEYERRIASEVLRSMGEAVAVCDLGMRFVNVNPAFCRITGYAPEDVHTQPVDLLHSEQHDDAFYRQVNEAVIAVGQWQGEMWQRRRDGEEYLASVEVNAVNDAHGERSHYVWVVSDITDRKRAEQELRYLANYDTLTGLPNRSLLSERLARAVVRARRQGTRVAVLFLDLDRFKDINDSMGHAAGDRILKSAAARLLATVRPQDTVARLGGDEFTVILEDLEDRRAAEEVAQRVIKAFIAPLEVEGRSEIIITPSIGLSLYPDHALVPTDLLKYADTAMYAAKDRGRNTYTFYNEAMDAEARRRASLVAALRRALDRREFYLVFQPRLDLESGRVAGFEALLRWRSEELGDMSPGEFIPVAEETGLILPIGEWVMREAFSVLSGWQAGGRSGLSMSINVSVLQLLRGDLVTLIRELLAEYPLPPASIELEVTESMVMANAEQATAALHQLKSLGVLLAIDDFGTGYSSLVYLKRLPIDTLKIDKEFVGDLTTDPDDEAITATIITMAHSLGLNVVAEGVETLEQLQYLHEQGCDEIQGYWLSRPLEESDCVNFLDHHDPALLLASAGLPLSIDR
jgi:diguanylate cyclase (GGDEF)-like protein/PAS domain S-box-containing protein